MGRRKKKPASAHRKTIQQAANQLFIENGVEATSVDKIAKTAGYSKATLYVYFENKEEIFFSLVHDYIRDLYRQVKRLTSKPPQTQDVFLKQYLQICFAIHQFCQNYPLYFEGLIGTIPVSITDSERPQVYKDIYKLGLELNKQVSLMIKRGILLDYLKPEIDIAKATLFIWSSLSGIIRMAEQKEDYYQLLGFDKEVILKEEFMTLLSCYQRK
ncbi:TetR/AcrR family transcriptional regulator [Streptococcus dentapri]|uniref:TetR/AcrR family transcriptional regulator n=1 Tax=Streptococcus dentapri TaxID=573564 RepID=A0ABV8CZD4_9STRE